MNRRRVRVDHVEECEAAPSQSRERSHAIGVAGIGVEQQHPTLGASTHEPCIRSSTRIFDPAAGSPATRG
jgi:hypothetical protein